MSGRSKPDLSGYNYSAISSLVLTADRSALPRRDREPDGAPTTLSGKIDPKEMGSRVQRSAPKDVEKKKKKAGDAAVGKDALDKAASARKRVDAGLGFSDILQLTQDVEGLRYRPRTAETREVYELMLSVVHQTLGDQANEIIRSATDTILETLKNDDMKDFDKKKEIEEILGSIPNDAFAQLVALAKKITDYGAEEETMADPDMEKKDAEIDDEIGVAVVFDEEEQEEDDDEGYEIREESDDEEDAEDGEGSEKADEDAGNDEELVIGGSTSETSKTHSDKDIVSPHAIDGFWVQRQISEVFPDATTAETKAKAALSVLGSEYSLRDCENQLFEYQNFHLITKFLKNRDVIVWCTKLIRSEADDRVNVEVAMREKGVGWILRELAGDRQKKKTHDDAMDVDKLVAVPKTATIAPGSTVQP